MKPETKKKIGIGAAITGLVVTVVVATRAKAAPKAQASIIQAQLTKGGL